MTKEEIEKIIINQAYEDLTLLFKNTGFCYRPVKVNGNVLWKDEDIENNRCNIIVENDKVVKVDGWY